MYCYWWGVSKIATNWRYLLWIRCDLRCGLVWNQQDCRYEVAKISARDTPWLGEEPTRSQGWHGSAKISAMNTLRLDEESVRLLCTSEGIYWGYIEIWWGTNGISSMNSWQCPMQGICRDMRDWRNHEDSARQWKYPQGMHCNFVGNLPDCILQSAWSSKDIYRFMLGLSRTVDHIHRIDWFTWDGVRYCKLEGSNKLRTFRLCPWDITMGKILLALTQGQLEPRVKLIGRLKLFCQCIDCPHPRFPLC